MVSAKRKPMLIYQESSTSAWAARPDRMVTAATLAATAGMANDFSGALRGGNRGARRAALGG
jgi:hypothetical protein